MEVWVVEFHSGNKDWKVNKVFITQAVAQLTAELYASNYLNKSWEYRYRRYVPELAAGET